MILPLSSESPLKRQPVVTLGIVALNIVVYIVMLVMDFKTKLSWAAIPGHIAQADPLTLAGWREYITLITSGFMHAGFFHLLFNMIFLMAFGCKVEDRLGRLRYALFYFAILILSGLTFVLAHTSVYRPCIGASGAISGVLGAYLFKFPHTRIRTLFWVIIRVWILRIPAFLLLGYWLLLNVIQFFRQTLKTSNVAWLTHLAGFIVGVVLIGLMTGFRIESSAKEEKTHDWHEYFHTAGKMLRAELIFLLLIPLIMYSMAFVTTFFVETPYYYSSYTFSIRNKHAFRLLLSWLYLYMFILAVIVGIVWMFIRQRRLKQALMLEPCLMCKQTVKDDEFGDYVCQHCGFDIKQQREEAPDKLELLRELRVTEEFVNNMHGYLETEIVQSSLLSFDDEKNADLLRGFEESISVFRDFIQHHTEGLRTLLERDKEQEERPFTSEDLKKLSQMSPDYTHSGVGAKADIEIHREQHKILGVAVQFLAHVSTQLRGSVE